MINIKELIDDLGGPRAIFGGGVVCLFLLVSADHAISEVARRLAEVEQRAAGNSNSLTAEVGRLERDIVRLQEFAAVGPRVTPRDIGALEARLERIERILDK